jgi:23S rRNA pseudouridine2605 synthase
LANPYREQPNASEPTAKTDEKMPLNKYIAHCGICSRRDAIDLIKQGKVKVNDRIEKEPGYKVAEKDVILYEDAKVLPQRNLVYYLLNKPKDFITTTDDPEGRKTVMDLFKNVTEARIFPVGRLDRNTTGLLLMTNDGELTQKLSHPKHNTKKVYQVGLDKPLAKADFEAIANGLMLEDGLAEVDEVAFINPKDKKEIGIEIHSGRNRIVRRIFEHLNYEVKTLDRVIYAGLTKKNLPRGKFRELEPQEVIFLKHFK